jgi:type VI secretion system secreted protein VgrG
MARTMPRVMEITTPLGDDVLLFHGMHAREEMGRLGECQLDLLSPKKDINLDDILGKNVTVKLSLPDDSTRYFNGYVTRFAQSGQYGRYNRYFAAVRSWLWFLTRTTDCRIFQDMTVPDIVKKVFGDHTAADFALELTGTYRKWNYCVQYRETDFNFVSRLMEEEGIYYYVRHTDGHNTVVLTDSTGKHTASPGYETIPFIAREQVVRPELEHISSWDFSREIQPGVYVHDDYDLERPSVELKTRKELSRTYAPSDYEVYDYPGHYLQKADGEQYAAVRIDELGSQFETAQAVTNAKGIAVGSLFTLDAFPRDDQNREHLILAASYDLEFSDYEAMPEGAGTDYRCSFVAMSSQQQFRPKRATPKPFVQGPQTAMVVGPAGDEIYTDKFGRVKVQFHWDRYGKKDQNSSCWIRVSHPWAGKGWGSVATPRIGQEVIVDFLEGDPDQPIITGRVYNAESQPPFGFPAGAVLSGVKSNTHKGAGFNELSMDDTAGKERVFIHGQYNMDTVVEHDQTSTIHNNRTDRVDVDDAESVGKNQTCDVGVDQSLTVGSHRTKKVGAHQHREQERDGDRGVAAHAHCWRQRDDHRRRGAGSYRWGPAGGYRRSGASD